MARVKEPIAIFTLFVFLLVSPVAAALSAVETPARLIFENPPSASSRPFSVEALPTGAAPAIAEAMLEHLPAEYQLEDVGGGFTLSNPLHGMRVDFTAEGPRIESVAGTWGLSFSAIGYEGSVVPVAAAAPVNDDGRAVYRREAVDEWYVNSSWGIEHGFTLLETPERGADGALLVVELSLSGSLVPGMYADTLILADAEGNPVARYTGLQAFDDRYKSLPAHMELVEDTVRILVDDRQARYPIVIDPWIQKAILTPSDSGGFGSQGSPVAISGDTIVIGAPGNSGDEGAAYVYEKPATGWADMTEVARLYASDGEDEDEFGISVAIDGDTIVVGAWGDLNHRGSAYVFEKPANGWQNMFENAILTASSRGPFDFFGYSVAVSGETVVVGSYYSDMIGPSEGAAFVFEKPAEGWVDMTETAILSTTDHTLIDDFGKSVSISGETVVVGSDYGDGATSRSGTVYVFVKPAGGWTTMTTHTAELTASDGAEHDRFGYSVAIRGDTVAVGAFGDKDAYGVTNLGAVYVFEEPAVGWAGGLSEIAKLTIADTSTWTQLGLGVAIGSDLIAADGSSGGAYVFERPQGGWVDMTTESAHLGYPGPSGVALGENLLIVGYSYDYALVFARATLQVETIDTVEDTGDGSLAEGESVGVAVTEMAVTFNSEVVDPGGDSAPNDVTNPDNYLLLEAGGNGAFDTVDCAGGPVGDDLRVPIDGVTYDGGSLTATLSLNSAVALPAGMYRLHVCGTTSIENELGQKLDGDGDGTGGDDCVRGFSVADTDGDGDPDFSDPDDDGDGMSDDFENGHPGLDPLDPEDADDDLDFDGLTNLEEFEISSDMDPNDPDTDGDGLQDNLDATPVTANSLCAGNTPILDGVDVTDAQQCAAAVSVTLRGLTTVIGSGRLEVLSPLLSVEACSIHGELTVRTVDPCPACP